MNNLLAFAMFFTLMGIATSVLVCAIMFALVEFISRVFARRNAED